MLLVSLVLDTRSNWSAPANPRGFLMIMLITEGLKTTTENSYNIYYKTSEFRDYFSVVGNREYSEGWNGWHIV